MAKCINCKQIFFGDTDAYNHLILKLCIKDKPVRNEVYDW